MSSAKRRHRLAAAVDSATRSIARRLRAGAARLAPTRRSAC